MPQELLASTTLSVTELKADPMAAAAQAERGKPVAVLRHNKAAFYCVSPSQMAHFLALEEQLENLTLNRLADAALAESDELVEVSWDDL
jgi:antitoxin StbD